MLGSDGAYASPDRPILPGSPRSGDWVAFYSRDGDGIRQDFSYDRSRVRRNRDRVIARWRVLNTINGELSTTMYVVDIDCRRATFTEAGTVIIGADGRRRALPRSQLLVDGPIQAGTSTDLFRHSFCR
jgi:hypothetical protein